MPRVIKIAKVFRVSRLMILASGNSSFSCLEIISEECFATRKQSLALLSLTTAEAKRGRVTVISNPAAVQALKSISCLNEKSCECESRRTVND